MTDRRRIGLPSLIALVVANSVGIGVFTSSGFGLAVLPPDWLLLAWLVGGLVAICGALSYAGLAEALPESGGEYLYLHRLAHPLLGFLAGWISLTAGFTAAIAASALGLSLYAAPLLGFEIDARVLGTAAILLATAAHAAHLEAGLRVQNALVVLKLALLAAFLAIGARHLPDLTAASPASAAASPDLPAADLLGFGSQLVWIFFAYAGWNATVYLAGEVRDPSRNAPALAPDRNRRGRLALSRAERSVRLQRTAHPNSPATPAIATRAARILGGPFLEQAMAGTILLALLSSVSAMLLAGPRVYARMADDGVFPRFFAFDRHVPARAIWLQAALAILVVWLQTLSDILSTAGFLIWFSSAASVSLLFVLARPRPAPDPHRPSVDPPRCSC
jgi:amino acid transporter